MNELTDQQLLCDYAEHRSEAAFSELVRRHIDLVHSAAQRMVYNADLAKDVTQNTFITLAQSARHLKDRPVLSGWLHRTARNLATKVVRTDVRRRAREQEAAAMNELLSAEPDASWEQIAPHLDAALDELTDADRDAVLLRYFERRSARAMAQTLGISDDAAQKRVSRAVERLREFFAKRGVTVGAGGLVVVISANAVQAVPVGLATTIASAGALTGTTLAATATVTTKAIAMTTLQKTLVAATVAVLAGTGIYEARQTARLRAENADLREQTRQLSQLDQLRADNQRLAEQLKTELARPGVEREEILRLRGQVTALRQAESENVRLKTERDALAKRMEEESAKLPENDPGFQLRRDKMIYLGNWGLALKVYARTNNGRLPTSLAEAAPSMPNPDQFISAVGALFRDDQFEMACQGSLTNLGDPTRIIVVREKESVRVSNGKWARTYLFADGHTELHFTADGDFTAWEQERLPPGSRQ